MKYLLFGLILAIPAFIIQLLFCKFANNMVVKQIPLYIFFICQILLFLMRLGVFGTWLSVDVIANGNERFADILGIIHGVSLIGNIVAWIIYSYIKNLE